MMFAVCTNVETIAIRFDLPSDKDARGESAYAFSDGVISYFRGENFICEPYFRDWNGGRFDGISQGYRAKHTGLYYGDLVTGPADRAADVDAATSAGYDAMQKYLENVGVAK